MKVSDILPGSRVEIQSVHELNTAQKDEKVATYESAVFDILDEHSLEIYVPLSEGRLVSLATGLRYRFMFITKEGMFKAEGTIAERIKRDNFFLLKAVIPNITLERFQRREYFRLKCSLPVEFIAVSDETAAQETMADVYSAMKDDTANLKLRGEGTVVDISGGGMKFVSKVDLNSTNYVLVKLKISNGPAIIEIQLIAEVIDSEYMYDINSFSNRSRFLFKDTKFQEKIVSYIFEEERRIRQKGLK